MSAANDESKANSRRPTPDEIESTRRMPPMLPEAGQILSKRYRLIEKLGSGGMGEVWRAHDEELNETVAVKLLSRELLSDPMGVKGLKNEAKRLRTLSHRHILRLHTFEIDAARGNLPYLVMQYLKGQTLSALIAESEGGLPLERVMKWAGQIAEAIDFAHARGVVHRDIKPANLMIDEADEACLMDFGIARQVEQSLALVSQSVKWGSPAYLSRQQYEGTEDPRNDVFSLAATLYAALSGRQPFLGRDPAHRAAPAPLTGVPEHVNAALMTGMAEDMEARPTNAQHLVALLTAAPRLDDGAGGPRPSVLTRALVAWATVLVLIVAFVWWIESTRQPVRTEDAGPAVPQNPTPPVNSPALVQPAQPARTEQDRPALQKDAPAPGRPWTNSIGMEFVQIPAGEFLMGSPANETNRDNDETQHRVTLTKGYWLGKTEVSRGQFAAFVSASGYQTDAEREGWSYAWTGEKWDKVNGASWRAPGFDQTDEHPVVCVSWNDAKAFCDWLSTKEGGSFRLPTEAEWEYACRFRAEPTTAYQWGDDPDLGNGWCNGADQSFNRHIPGASGLFTWDDGYTFTAPVATFRPNAWGLYDMHGNVWEWCADWYGEYPSGRVSDPKGPNVGSSRVLRGGSWNYDPWGCRSAGRVRGTADGRNDNIGFRVALDSE